MQKPRAWERLSLFESHDFVGAWYFKRHNRKLNTAQTRGIISCFTLGREYFSSASVAASSVRPLLLYYGALSLSRGLILLLNSTKNEESLKPSHGLEVVDWGKTLAGGIQGVLSLGIRATKGTFPELACASENLQFTACWTEGNLQLGQYHAKLAPLRFCDDGTILTLDDLVSRDHRFLSLYEAATGRKGRVHLSEVIIGPNDIEFCIFPVGGPFCKEAVENQFGWPTDTVIHERSSSKRLPIPNLAVMLKGDDIEKLKRSLPVTQYSTGDGLFALQDFENGDRMSELLRTFLLSYFLSMMVRYYPSRWIALLRNEKGDAAQPVLMATVNAIEDDFPQLISAALA